MVPSLWESEASPVDTEVGELYCAKLAESVMLDSFGSVLVFLQFRNHPPS